MNAFNPLHFRADFWTFLFTKGERLMAFGRMGFTLYSKDFESPKTSLLYLWYIPAFFQ